MSKLNGEKTQSVKMEEMAPDVATETQGVKENGLPNGTRLPNANGFVKIEPMTEVDRKNDVTNGNGSAVAVKVEDHNIENVMEGMEDIKISDSMDVDCEVVNLENECKANGAASKDEIMKTNGAHSGPTKAGNFAMKTEVTETLNGAVANFPVQPQIVPKCANGKLSCTLEGLSSFPCKRCHRVFYCCEPHRSQHFKDHQPDCKTVSSLEVIFNEDEYTMWLKHAAPHLYDVCLNFVLVWPSLTAQWLPEVIECENEVLRHQLLLGTMTNQEQNHLLICGVDVHPKSKSDGTLDHAAKFKGTMYVTKRINHEAEVNRARYMPQNYNIVATKSSSPEVFIFDCQKYPEVPEDSKFSPLLRLRGHQKEGFGLSWNLKENGKILSGSNDALVCLWDLNMAASSDSNNVRYLNACRTFRAHEDVVEDVDWHQEHRHLFASVGDDKRLILWDTRVNAPEEAVYVCKDAHGEDINAVSFSPFSEFCLATGSSDKTVAVWDIRNIKKKLFILDYHQGEVMQVQWSPHNASILASTGKDSRVFIWDLAKAGETSAQMEDDPAPPELAFIHGGHIAHVNDISWNQHEKGMIASVTEDNILQVWKMTEDLQCQYNGEDSDDDSFGGSASETFDD